MTTADTAYALTNDAARTALALLLAYRNGDVLAGMQLSQTLNDQEKGYLVGSLLAFLNQALNMCEQLSGNSAEDVLRVMALGFDQPDESSGPWPDLWGC